MKLPEGFPVLSDENIGPLPFGLMSLADMINYQIFGFTNFLQWITASESDARNLRRNAEAGDMAQRLGVALPPVSRTVNDKQVEQSMTWLAIGHQHCELLQLDAAKHRIELFQQKLRHPMTVADYEAELRALDEALHGDFRFIYFYHYPRREAERVLKFDHAWEAIVAPDKFPSVKDDAKAAVDCWALGHGTASVFHSMRVAEHGLRALARERKVTLPRGRPLEYGEWGAVIDSLRAKVIDLSNKPARYGQRREAAVSFYSGAIGELEAFRDVYRNPVSHTRRSFDQPQAESVLNHVHGFMGRLAAKLGESPKRQIAWGIA